jgi:hypothetical protein
MAEPTPSLPPSEPRSSGRPSAHSRAPVELGVGASSLDRPARIQMIVALVLGLVLVVIPLYLWRRPRAEAEPISNAADGQPAVVLTSAEAGAFVGAVDAGAPPVAFSEVHVLECHDPGTKKTAPGECDHLVAFDKAFTKAIEDATSCVPSSAGGGSIVYVADVSFQRKKSPINLTLPKEGRTMKNAKVIAACNAAVKKNLAAVQLDPGQQHQHTRYKISVTATYPGPVK